MVILCLQVCALGRVEGLGVVERKSVERRMERMLASAGHLIEEGATCRAYAPSRQRQSWTVSPRQLQRTNE